MLGELTRDQCEHVLRSEIVGRIGCHSSEKVYIVPVTYAYHEGYIYAQSKVGLKIKMMRKSPNVCFQVDSRENPQNWRSVLVWGKYEEMKTTAQQRAATKILFDRLLPYSLSETLKPAPFQDPPHQIEKEFKPIIYRISVDEVSGRFEKSGG